MSIKPVHLTIDQFIHELEVFKAISDKLIDKVQTSARNRYYKGIPALREQDAKTHGVHLEEHLHNFMSDSCGDEASIEEQAIHVACRALLLVYTYAVEKNLSIDELFPEKK